MRTLLLLISLFVICGLNAQDLKLASPFKDHMVLQRDMSAPVWGWSIPETKVMVEFEGEKLTAMADSLGKWRVEIRNHKTGGPYKLIVKGKEKITINDVYVGEVWLCSGQSNMDMTVAKEDRYWCGVYNEKEEVENANYPEIRFFDVAFSPLDDEQDTVSGKWELCTPENIGHLSAAAYFFGRELYLKYKVPIGLITSAYGASTVEAWTSLPKLKQNTEYKFLLDNYAAKCAVYDTAEFAKKIYENKLANWEVKLAEAKKERKKLPRKPKNPNPHVDQHMPGVLYNGMISPLIPYAIKGAIWYQGESNQNTADIYDKQMESMVYNWREEWQQGDFPFIYVQLANYREQVSEPVKDNPFVLVREKQLKNLSIRNTAMVVAIDNANPDNPGDIHPKNKQEIGKRLAIAAMGKVYGEKITFMGPVFNHMDIMNGNVKLYFDHVGDGFMVKGDKIKGFAIAGADKKFVWADAKIGEDFIQVSSNEVQNPVYVRYGWAINPDVNLYNKIGLPASPFRTDDL